MNNIVMASIVGEFACTEPRYQYDYGQILKIEGLELPTAYEVHFSNMATGGSSITAVGGEDGVAIPDDVLKKGSDVYAFIFLHTGEDDGETVYKIKIPVIARPSITDETPTPTQQSAIDEAIIALNSAVCGQEDFSTCVTHLKEKQMGIS